MAEEEILETAKAEKNSSNNKNNNHHNNGERGGEHHHHGDSKGGHHHHHGESGGEHHHHHGDSNSSHHHHHSSHYDRKHDSQQLVVKERMRKVKWEKSLKPMMRMLFFFALIILMILIIWAMAHPSPTVTNPKNEETEVITETQEIDPSTLTYTQLKRDIESLKTSLDKYEQKIAKLEAELDAYAADASRNLSENEGGQTSDEALAAKIRQILEEEQNKGE